MDRKRLMGFACLVAVMAIGLASGLAAEGADAGARGTKKPVKVFILAGQSNMQGHAHVRTFDAMALDPKTALILKEMRNADGTPRVCEKVWISSIGSADEEQVGKVTAGFGAKERSPKIGPEFTFGIYAQKLLDEPIVIIKTAWGGKSLHTEGQREGDQSEAGRDQQPGQGGHADPRTRQGGNGQAVCETFSPRELTILKDSTSNFDLHYMGSAKVMTQIGKGFAEAMVAMLK